MGFLYLQLLFLLIRLLSFFLGRLEKYLRFDHLGAAIMSCWSFSATTQNASTLTFDFLKDLNHNHTQVAKGTSNIPAIYQQTALRDVDGCVDGWMVIVCTYLCWLFKTKLIMRPNSIQKPKKYPKNCFQYVCA